MEAQASGGESTRLAIQVPFSRFPGGVQVEHVFVRTTSGPEPAPKPADPRQGVLPLTGVKPGASWRRRDPEPERGRPELTPEQLGFAFHGLHKHRGRVWDENDRRTMEEVHDRSWSAVDVGQRFSIAEPQWFGCAVIRRLRPFVALVWAAYDAGAFGVNMTTCQLAAQLDTCERTIRNYRREAEELGLLRAIKTWRESERGVGSEQGPSLYRIGPALEHWAGPVAFERSKGRRPRGHTRAKAWARGNELREQTRRVRWELEGNAWRSSPRKRRSEGSTADDAPRTSAPSSAEPTPSSTSRTSAPSSTSRTSAPSSTSRTSAPSSTSRTSAPSSTPVTIEKPLSSAERSPIGSPPPGQADRSGVVESLQRPPVAGSLSLGRQKMPTTPPAPAPLRGAGGPAGLGGGPAPRTPPVVTMPAHAGPDLATPRADAGGSPPRPNDRPGLAAGSRWESARPSTERDTGPSAGDGDGGLYPRKATAHDDAIAELRRALDSLPEGSAFRESAAGMLEQRTLPGVTTPHAWPEGMRPIPPRKRS